MPNRADLLRTRGRPSDKGLRVLAFGVPLTVSKGGDFTSENINPGVWQEVTRSIDQHRVHEAQAWAADRDLDAVVAEALSSVELRSMESGQQGMRVQGMRSITLMQKA